MLFCDILPGSFGQVSSPLNCGAYYYAFITFHVELPAYMSAIALDCELLEVQDPVLSIFMFTMHENEAFIKYVLMNE